MVRRKWSETTPEGLLLSRILKKLSKIEAKFTDKSIDKWDDDKFDRYMRLAKVAGLVAEKKTKLAHATDWEDRIKELERANALTLADIQKYKMLGDEQVIKPKPGSQN